MLETILILKMDSRFHGNDKKDTKQTQPANPIKQAKPEMLENF
jgi:hypothetical protein